MNLNPFKKAAMPEKNAAALQSAWNAALERCNRLSAICSDTYDNSSARYKLARKQVDLASAVHQIAKFELSLLKVNVAVKEAADLANKEIASSKALLEDKKVELAAAKSQLDKQVARREPLTRQLEELGQADAANLQKTREEIEAATVGGDQAALARATDAMAKIQARARAAQDQTEVLRLQDRALERDISGLTAKVNELETQLQHAESALNEALKEPLAIRLDSASLEVIYATVDYLTSGAFFDRAVLAGFLVVGHSQIVRRLAGEHLKVAQIEFDTARNLARCLKEREANEAGLREDPMKLDAGTPRPKPLPEIQSNWHPGSENYRAEQEAAARRLNS